MLPKRPLAGDLPETIALIRGNKRRFVGRGSREPPRNLPGTSRNLRKKQRFKPSLILSLTTVRHRLNTSLKRIEDCQTAFELVSDTVLKTIRQGLNPTMRLNLKVHLAGFTLYALSFKLMNAYYQTAEARLH